jgi:MFS family permease
VFGFGYGCLNPMMAILTVDRFGRDIYGTAYGLLIFFTVGIGGSLGPIFGGFVYDVTGSYTRVWQIELAVIIFVTVLIQFLKPARAGAARK